MVNLELFDGRDISEDEGVPLPADLVRDKDNRIILDIADRTSAPADSVDIRDGALGMDDLEDLKDLEDLDDLDCFRGCESLVFGADNINKLGRIAFNDADGFIDNLLSVFSSRSITMEFSSISTTLILELGGIECDICGLGTCGATNAGLTDIESSEFE